MVWIEGRGYCKTQRMWDEFRTKYSSSAKLTTVKTARVSFMCGDRIREEISQSVWAESSSFNHVMPVYYLLPYWIHLHYSYAWVISWSSTHVYFMPKRLCILKKLFLQSLQEMMSAWRAIMHGSTPCIRLTHNSVHWNLIKQNKQNYWAHKKILKMCCMHQKFLVYS